VWPVSGTHYRVSPDGPAAGAAYAGGMPSLELERVRRHTSARSNQRIDTTIAETIHHYAGRTEGAIAARLDELDREWDIERVLQAHAATIALASIGLATVHRRWLAFTTGVLGFLMLHATQGWCPPLPVFRRLGVRTRGEIEREKFALRYLRGDFDHVRTPDGQISLPRLLHALQG
jgi:hypothetical protein